MGNQCNKGGVYNWHMATRCKGCQYRSPAIATPSMGYSCDYASITGRTRTGELIKLYGRNFSKALLEPKHCPFRKKGMRLSTLTQEIVEGRERSMKQLKPRFMQLYNRGMTDAEIGNQIHKSSNTVAEFRRSLGLEAHERKPAPAHPVDDEIAEAMYKAGMNDAEIANKFGCAPSAVLRWRRKRNLKPNAPQGWQGGKK